MIPRNIEESLNFLLLFEMIVIMPLLNSETLLPCEYIYFGSATFTCISPKHEQFICLDLGLGCSTGLNLNDAKVISNYTTKQICLLCIFCFWHKFFVIINFGFSLKRLLFCHSVCLLLYVNFHSFDGSCVYIKRQVLLESHPFIEQFICATGCSSLADIAI